MSKWKRPVTPDEMRAHAETLRRRADAVTSSAWDNLRTTPGPSVTGSANWKRSGLARQSERASTRLDNAILKAKALRDSAAKWDARADRDDPVKIAQRMRHKETQAKAKATYHDFLRDTIKVGDFVHVGGNSPVKVIRVNAKSITSEGGVNWKYDEVCRFDSTALEMETFRQWRDEGGDL